MPASISARLAPQDAGHGGGAVRFKNVGDDAEGVGRLFRGGQHGSDGTFRQCAVADFAASGAGHTAGFADGEGRKVVMKHQPLLLLAFIAFQALHVVRSAKSNRDECLCFAAGKTGPSRGVRGNTLVSMVISRI